MSLTLIKWIGTAAQLAGVYAMAGKMLRPLHAYAVMLAGSAVWAGVAILERDWPLAVLNLAFTGSNLLGIWRWRHG